MAVETSSDLQVSVTEDSSSSRRVSVTVPRARVERVRRSVTTQLTRNARLPGFRKGKLPQSLIEKQFGPSIEQETRERVIQETYREALERENLVPLGQGDLQSAEVGESGDLTYTVVLEVQPTLSLARVGGFVVPRPSEQVGDDEVSAVLERLRTDRATVAPVEEGTPDLSDEVTVEITALDQEGAEPQPYRFALGEGQAIAPIEEAIRSLSVGEEREFDIDFPEDFPEAEQAGTTQRMRIRLVELRRREFPELDDEFAASLGDFDTLDALRERIRSDLQDDARRRAEAGVRDALIGQIVEANPIDVPEAMIGRYLEWMMNDVPDRGGRRRERSPEQEERFSQLRQLMRPQAEAALRRMMVIEHLADREALRATQDEIDERVEKIAEQTGRSPSDVWLELEKAGQLQSLEGEITEDKVFEWLRAQNTVG